MVIVEKRVKVLCAATSYSAAIGFWKETELCKATHLSDLPDHPMVTSQQRLSAEAAMLIGFATLKRAPAADGYDRGRD